MSLHRSLVPIAVAILPCISLAQAEELGHWTERQPFPQGAQQVIHYYLFTPAALKPDKKYPLVIWLHGGVKSNGQGSPSLPSNAFHTDEHQRRHACFILRPVAIKGQNWVSPRGASSVIHEMPPQPADSIVLLMKLLDKVLAEEPIDPKQVHVIGASMGGYGTWDVVSRYPDRFASAVPICGGADPEQAPRLKDCRIWAFHGAKDSIVRPNGTRAMFDALMQARGVQPEVEETDSQIRRQTPDGRLRFTEYKAGSHNVWDAAMTDLALHDWMFEGSGE